METKINQRNAQIKSGLIYYWSITPTCFGPSVGAIIREYEILELQSHCIDLLECCYVYVSASRYDSYGMLKHSTAIISRRGNIYSKTCLKRNAIVPVFFFSFSLVSVLQRVVF